MTRPTLYRTRIAHARSEDATHSFTYAHTMWLVDLDALPALPRPLRPLLRFDARDHLGDPSATIRRNVDDYLADRDITLEGGRVLMLANPRSLGHGFNPLTVFWCYHANGGLACVVAEVQNTHGERHCYLLRPDAEGRARVPKEFYVSPFFAVDGTYDLQLSEPDETVWVSISLRHGPSRAPAFTATLAGRRQPVRSLLGAALRHPVASWKVSALIRFEGLRLWSRRLAIVPWSPQHVEQS